MPRSPRPAAKFLRTFQSMAALRAFSTASAPPSMKEKAVQRRQAHDPREGIHKSGEVNGVDIRTGDFDLGGGQQIGLQHPAG